MNTTAVSTLIWTFEVMITIAVIFLLLYGGQAYAESLTVHKATAAEDIRMMVNILAGIPGEAMVEYPKDVSKLTFILRPDRITVFQKNEPDVKHIRIFFYLPDGYTAEGVLEEKSRLCLQKKENKIVLRECP